MWPRSLVPARGYKVTDLSPMVVHSGDGSDVGMSAVAHLVTELLDNDPAKVNGVVNHVALIKVTGRLVPLSGLSVPRVELAAGHLCTLMAASLLDELSIPLKKTIFLTDSQSTLAQINSRQSLFEPWVLSRLRAINSKTDRKDWFKVDGTQNSADIPSKAHTKPLPALLNSKLWRKGEFME